VFEACLPGLEWDGMGWDGVGLNMRNDCIMIEMSGLQRNIPLTVRKQVK